MEHQLKVGAFHKFHGEEIGSFNFAMLMITHNVFVLMNPCQNLASLHEAFSGGGIILKIVMQPTKCVGVVVVIRGKPDLGHAAAIDQFAQLIVAEGTRFT